MPYTIAADAYSAGMPNCAVADCEYKATEGSDKCYCHSLGFNPPLTYEQYQSLDFDDLPAYRAELRRLAQNVTNAP